MCINPLMLVFQVRKSVWLKTPQKGLGNPVTETEFLCVMDRAWDWEPGSASSWVVPSNIHNGCGFIQATSQFCREVWMLPSRHCTSSSKVFWWEWTLHKVHIQVALWYDAECKILCQVEEGIPFLNERPGCALLLCLLLMLLLMRRVYLLSPWLSGNPMARSIRTFAKSLLHPSSWLFHVTQSGSH